MAFVQFSQVSLAFGDRDILNNVTINLQTGSKVALTGTNGAGKSTLIKVLAGLVKPDSGERALQKDCRIAYLPQSGLTHHGCTLKEEADKAFAFGYDIQKEIDQIGEELTKNPPNTQALLERQADLIQKLDDSGWHRRQAAAESVLLGLGFERKDFERKGYGKTYLRFRKICADVIKLEISIFSDKFIAKNIEIDYLRITQNKEVVYMRII